MFLITLLATLSGADAGAYYFTDAGTRGMAKAGANIASVDDLSAQYYNPAGLMKLGRNQAYLNHSMVQQSIDFQRIDYDEDGNVIKEHESISNLAPMMQIPQFSVGNDLGLDDFMFAIGLHPPFAPDLKYSADGPQRYSLVDSTVLQFYAGPTAAWQPLEWLSVGAGVYWTWVSADYGLALLTCTTPEDPYRCEEESEKYDVDVLMQMKDVKRFTWNAGIMVDPIEQVTIGISLLPPLNVEGKGSLTADFGEEHLFASYLNGSTFTDDDITVLMTLPLILRTGVAVRPTPMVEVEVAAVYQRWRDTKELRVTDLELVLERDPDSSVLEEDIVVDDDVVLPAGYNDMMSWRLGVEVQPKEWLTVRTGAYYEPTAVPPTTQSVALVDGDKWGFGLGGSYHYKKALSFDLGYSRTQIAPRDIKDSEVAHVMLPIDLAAALTGGEVAGEIQDGGIVGNGSFKSFSQYVSAGVTVYWGKEKGEG